MLDLVTDGSRTLDRAGWLTPSAAQILARDVLRIGRRERLEITVPVATGSGTVRRFGASLARLVGRRPGMEPRQGPTVTQMEV